jgi:hypothetical protein
MGAEAVGGLAAKAGVDASYVSQLVEAGVLREGVGESDAGAARIRIAQALMSSGIPLQTLGDAIEQGVLSLDFSTIRASGSSRPTAVTHSQMSPERPVCQWRW